MIPMHECKLHGGFHQSLYYKGRQSNVPHLRDIIPSQGSKEKVRSGMEKTSILTVHR